MRLHHLIEAVNLQPLEEIWKEFADPIVDGLEKTGDANAQMLGRIISKSVSKTATVDSLKLLSFINSLIKISEQLGQANTHYLRMALNHFLNRLATEISKTDEKTIKHFLSKVDTDKLKPYLDKKVAFDLTMSVNKAKRTRAEKKFDKENDLYIFIGRPGFVETPEGSGNYRKSLEIEKLVKIDRFDAEAHQMAQMMKLRATYQGENSDVYVVNLPKGTVKDIYDLDPWLVDLIDKHKRRVTN